MLKCGFFFLSNRVSVGLLTPGLLASLGGALPPPPAAPPAAATGLDLLVSHITNTKIAIVTETVQYT